MSRELAIFLLCICLLLISAIHGVEIHNSNVHIDKLYHAYKEQQVELSLMNYEIGVLTEENINGK